LEHPAEKVLAQLLPPEAPQVPVPEQGEKHLLFENWLGRRCQTNPLGRRQLSNLRVYPGAEHPHEAQQPEKVDIGKMNPKNTNYRKAS